MAATPSAAPPAARPGAAAAWLWVHTSIAALAMVLTLPGRTHGLGLVTEPLLTDLGLERVSFAALNFWATLIGAAFCIPVGWLIDRLGVRVVLATTLLGLGVTVVAMARATPASASISLPTPEVFFVGGVEWTAMPVGLFLLVLLTRGLGQSALSVASLALVGKATGDRPGIVIGVYSFLVAVGFMAAFYIVQKAFEKYEVDWRSLWAGIGWVLIGCGVLAAVFVREPQPASTKQVDAGPATPSLTLWESLRTPGFWVFALATSFYGLVAAGMSLFNQSLLAERNFNRSVFLTITTVTPLIGLAANLLAGFLATRIRLGVVLAAGLLILTVSLAAFPHVSTLTQVYAYAVGMGVAGGILTVVFFTVWRQAFGPAYLGQVQGAAQLLTVLASAAGPLVLAAGQRAHGSYVPVVVNLAIVADAFALAALLVPLPNSNRRKALA
jgi:MFS family permease